MKKLSVISFLLGLLITASAWSSATSTTKTISFATEATYPPFEYMTVTGKIRGFDIDIAQALCKQMNAQCSFANQPWDSLIPSLKLGKFDALIGAMAITDARKQQVDFTDSYYEPTASLAAPLAAHLALNKNSLKGKTIGTQGGTTFAQYLQAKYGNVVKITTYNSIQDALLDLSSGRVNAVLGDTPTITDWVNKHGGNRYVTVGQPIADTQYLGNGFGIAVKKGNSQLLNEFNAALAAIKADGTYNTIYDQYFSKNS